jgi:outer membrane phospholipase A
VRPSGVAEWPQSLLLELSGAGVSEEITLEPKSEGDGNRRLYGGRTHKRFVGIVRAELADQPSNRVVMLASEDNNTGPVQIAAPTVAAEDGQADPPAKRPEVVIAQPGEEPALSANEPSYFLIGSNEDNATDARFQLSFKYRPFAPDGTVADYLPYLSNLYFGYTQTSLWDIGDDSSPFRDTSYRPSLYYRWVGDGGQFVPYEWSAGYEHESNGQSAEDSRSIDMAFVRPTWHFDFANGRRLTFMPKFYHYLEKSDNSDIHHYRGYADWQMRYGREDGFVVSGLYRQGTHGYATGQLDFSYPLSNRIFARTGTFVHLQVFSGYGETLLDYNVDRGTQVRLGISLIR